MSRRGLTIALFASLAVNLFVIGGLAGAVLIGQRLHGARPHGPVGLMRGPLMAAGEALPTSRREVWIAAMRDEAGASGPMLGEARRLRRDAWRRLAAEPPDAAAVLADLERSRTLEHQARAAFDRRIVGFASGLPAAERQRFAEALARPGRRGPGPMSLGGGRPGPPERPPDR